MAPVLKEIKQQLGDSVSIIKIDVDKNPQASAAYSIQGVPTLILFQKGEIKWRHSGVPGARQLKEILERFIPA